MHSYNTASPNWYILFSNTVQLYLDKLLCDFVMGSWETINPSLYHNSTWYTVLFHCKLCTNTVHQVGLFLFSCPSRAVVTVIIMIVRVIIHKVAIIEIIMEYTKVVKYTQVAIMKWTDSLRSKKSRKSSLLHLPFKRPIARSTFCLSDERTVLNLLCWAVKWPLSV